MARRDFTYYEQQIEKVVKGITLKKYHYHQLRESKAFMEKYYWDNISLERIANISFMSLFHFIKIFKDVYGMTPGKYLRDLRISKAKELLKKGETITSVSYSVGYESLPSFSKAFKLATGYTPKKYQKLNFPNPG